MRVLPVCNTSANSSRSTGCRDGLRNSEIGRPTASAWGMPVDATSQAFQLRIRRSVSIVITYLGNGDSAQMASLR